MGKLINLMKLPKFDSEEDNRVARILYAFLICLPIAFSVFIATRLQVRDFLSIRVLLGGLFILMASIWFIRRKQLKSAIFMMALTLIGIITGICTFGQGIHDISIMGYPGILIVSSLLLNRKYFFILTGLTILSAAWLSLGEASGLFIAKAHEGGDFLDFGVITAILILSALLSYQLAQAMRLGLAKAHQEIARGEELTLKLKDNLDQKEILLKEVHHRVKNNLSIIIGLLNLQENSGSKVTVKAIQDTRNRIYSMALVHERLYRSGDLSRISMRDYVEFMGEHLLNLFDAVPRIKIQNEVEEIVLNIDQAIPCGMILNEIMTNAIKHAFGGREGSILVRMKKTDNALCRMHVSDNGLGLPWKIRPGDPQTLGLRLISLLTKQLDGNLEVSCAKGTLFRIEFPIQ